MRKGGKHDNRLPAKEKWLLLRRPLFESRRQAKKWIATKLPVSTTSERKAQKALDEIRMQYEHQEEARASKEAMEAVLTKNGPPEAQVPFADYMEKWLSSVRPSIATATYPELLHYDEGSGDPVLHGLPHPTRRAHATAYRGLLPDHPQ